METSIDNVKDPENVHCLYEILGGYMYVFTIFKNIFILVGICEKEPSVIAMQNVDYFSKMLNIIHGCISERVYLKTNGNTLHDISRFKDFS